MPPLAPNSCDDSVPEECWEDAPAGIYWRLAHDTCMTCCTSGITDADFGKDDPTNPFNVILADALTAVFGTPDPKAKAVAAG